MDECKPLPEGVDPKTILCAYFEHGCCAKTAEKCKFSHKLNINERGGTGGAAGGDKKRDIYEGDVADEADTMELWDQARGLVYDHLLIQLFMSSALYTQGRLFDLPIPTLRFSCYELGPLLKTSTPPTLNQRTESARLQKPSP